jgi:hypothetical protein
MKESGDDCTLGIDRESSGPMLEKKLLKEFAISLLSVTSMSSIIY